MNKIWESIKATLQLVVIIAIVAFVMRSIGSGGEPVDSAYPPIDEVERMQKDYDELYWEYDELRSKYDQLSNAYQCLSNGVEEIMDEMEYSKLYDRYEEVEDWHMRLSIDWATCD